VGGVGGAVGYVDARRRLDEGASLGDPMG
jgi:hypothetical protein